MDNLIFLLYAQPCLSEDVLKQSGLSKTKSMQFIGLISSTNMNFQQWHDESGSTITPVVEMKHMHVAIYQHLRRGKITKWLKTDGESLNMWIKQMGYT